MSGNSPAVFIVVSSFQRMFGPAAIVRSWLVPHDYGDHKDPFV